MSSDIYNLLDELVARGRRLRQQLPGDVFPFGPGSPTADQLEEVRALFLTQPMTRQERSIRRAGR